MSFSCCSWTLPDLRAAVFAALHAAKLLHGQGLVHMDLRPDNILWRHGTPFVTDLEQVHKAGFEVNSRHIPLSLERPTTYG